MPDAARISDLHTCPKVEPGPVPHVGGPIFTGSANVIIGYLPAGFPTWVDSVSILTAMVFQLFLGSACTIR